MSKYSAMMAHTYSNQNVNDWFACRKFKGWRALWNGYKLETLGRFSGPKTIFPPTFWAKNLPHGKPLDGELWHPTSDSEEYIKSVVGQSPIRCIKDPRWEAIRYVVYDYKPYQVLGLSYEKCLEMSLDASFHKNLPWQARQEKLARLIANLIDNKYIIRADQMHIRDDEDFQKYIKWADTYKWEGLMLSNPAEIYYTNRVYNLLKVKPSYDYEAVVVGYCDGEGRHEGRMGALMCQLCWTEQVTEFKGGMSKHVDKTVVFKIGGGFSDEQREQYSSLFPIGQIVSFTFLSVTGDGIPASANFSGLKLTQEV